MTIQEFPPVEFADERGLLAIGGDLEVDSLLLAYRSGVFPWPLGPEFPVTWFAPPQRALLFVDEFRLPRSLRKTLRRTSDRFWINRDLRSVISSCRETRSRKRNGGTWITPFIQDAYERLGDAGFCHSVECYRDEVLVGGIYGVSIGGMFAGESMFYRVPDASKCCLVLLMRYLASNGVRWMDCQVQSPLLCLLGAREIDRCQFMELLKGAISATSSPFPSRPLEITGLLNSD